MSRTPHIDAGWVGTAPGSRPHPRGAYPWDDGRPPGGGAAGRGGRGLRGGGPAEEARAEERGRAAEALELLPEAEHLIAQELARVAVSARVHERPDRDHLGREERDRSLLEHHRDEPLHALLELFDRRARHLLAELEGEHGELTGDLEGARRTIKGREDQMRQ